MVCASAPSWSQTPSRTRACRRLRAGFFWKRNRRTRQTRKVSHKEAVGNDCASSAQEPHCLSVKFVSAAPRLRMTTHSRDAWTAACERVLRQLINTDSIESTSSKREEFMRVMAMAMIGAGALTIAVQPAQAASSLDTLYSF